MDRPNILWICTDQQRYDTIACMGSPHIRTPRLDRLASEGVAFSHAFAQNPVCTPSRASFLTGRYPRTTRARQNGQNIPEDEVLVTRMLGDHGIFLKGPHMYDCAVRVPLIISWPTRFGRGLVSDALVELVDLAPMLLDAAGLETPARMQGRSLLGICDGTANPHEHKDAVYAEYYNAMPFHNWHRPRPYVTMVRTRTHKLAVTHGLGTGELYDLEADPGEHRNLWDSPGHKDVKIELLTRLADAAAFTADPIPERIADW